MVNTIIIQSFRTSRCGSLHVILLIVLIVVAPSAWAQSATEQAFEIYAGSEKLTFSAERGKTLWNQKNISKKDGKERNCHTCHGTDLTKMGKHVKSGKEIEPMALSVNKERFTKLKKIKKWFKRNCKWTFGRECINQEKGDLLTYLIQL